MFGYHKARRERRRLKRQKEMQQKPQVEDAAAKKAESDAKIQEKVQQSAAKREEAYATGKKRVQDLYNDPTIQGLDPKEKAALQYEANKQAQRNFQSNNRKLLGEQSMHGIKGQGGVGYAQQRDLMRQANEAQGAATRDLNKLDSERRMQNIAAIFAGQQGEAAQALLELQLALDEQRLEEERKKAQLAEDRANQQFNRI